MILKNLTKITDLNKVNTSFGHTTYDGINEYTSLPNGTTVFLPLGYTEATWSMWVKTTDTTGIMFRQYDGGATSSSPLINMTAGGFYYFYCDSTTGAGTASRRTSSISINDGTWKLLTHVYKGSTNLDIYIDGVLRNGALQNSIKSSITSISITNEIGNTNFAASIDEVAIWNRDLTPTEILTIYNKGRNQPDYTGIPNLVSHYRMESLNPIDIIGGNNATSINQDPSNIVKG